MSDRFLQRRGLNLHYNVQSSRPAPFPGSLARMGQDPPTSPRRSRLPELLIVLAVAALIPFWLLAPGRELEEAALGPASNPTQNPALDPALTSTTNPSHTTRAGQIAPALSPGQERPVSFDEPAEAGEPGKLPADQFRAKPGSRTPSRSYAPAKADPQPEPSPELASSDVPLLTMVPVVFAPTGDFNADGSIDELDEELFSHYFDSADPVADLNNDGLVDAADIVTFAEARETN